MSQPGRPPSVVESIARLTSTIPPTPPVAQSPSSAAAMRETWERVGDSLRAGIREYQDGAEVPPTPQND